MLQTVLDAQISNCQNMPSMVTTAVIGAMKELLISDPSPPLPTSLKKKSRLQSSVFRSQLKSDKLKKLRMAITTKAPQTDLLMDTFSPET